MTCDDTVKSRILYKFVSQNKPDCYSIGMPIRVVDVYLSELLIINGQLLGLFCEQFCHHHYFFKIFFSKFGQMLNLAGMLHSAKVHGLTNS